MEVSREPGSNSRLFSASEFRITGNLVPGKLFNLIGKSLGSLCLPEAGKGNFPSAHSLLLLLETGFRGGQLLELSLYSHFLAQKGYIWFGSTPNSAHMLFNFFFLNNELLGFPAS